MFSWKPQACENIYISTPGTSAGACANVREEEEEKNIIFKFLPKVLLTDVGR